MTMEIQLPQGKLQWSRTGGPLLVVVAGGRRPDPQWLRRAAEGLPVAAADRERTTAGQPGWSPGSCTGTGTVRRREPGRNLPGREPG